MEDSRVRVVELARPLRDFLIERYHPHAKIIIDTEKVVIVEDDFGSYFNEEN